MQAVTKDGKLRYRTESDRAGNKSRIRDVKAEKSYEFRDEIVREVIQVINEAFLPNCLSN